MILLRLQFRKGSSMQILIVILGSHGVRSRWEGRHPYLDNVLKAVDFGKERKGFPSKEFQEESDGVHDRPWWRMVWSLTVSDVGQLLIYFDLLKNVLSCPVWKWYEVQSRGGPDKNYNTLCRFQDSEIVVCCQWTRIWCSVIKCVSEMTRLNPECDQDAGLTKTVSDFHKWAGRWLMSRE